jgi:hypothetical protein
MAANTYSGSIGVGRRYDWLVGWQAKEEAAVRGSFRLFSIIFQQAKLTRCGPCLGRKFCFNLSCNRLYIDV